jgi:TPR repeat protein
MLFPLLLSFNISANFINAQKHLDNGEFEKSFNEFHKVAILGNVRAQYNVALMLFKGKGIEKNTVKAYAWSRTAGSSKSSTKELTDTITKNLSNSQLMEAQNLAKTYIDLYGINATKISIGPTVTESKNDDNKISQINNTANFNKIVTNQISNKNLIYPNKAIKKGRRGWVDLIYDIMPDGTVQNIQIFHQYPHELFAPSAIEFAQQQIYDFYMDENKVKSNQSVIAGNRFKYGVEGWSGILGRKLEMKIDKLYRKAIKGDLQSQYSYTNLFYTVLSQNGMVSEKMINRWLFRASQFGMPTAQYRLGKNIYFGNSCELDKQKGLDWLLRSSQGGNTQAQYLTYQILRDNSLKNTSDKSAQQWLYTAAENQSYISQFIIAKQIVSQNQLSESEILLTENYLKNYATFVGKTIDWFQTKASLKMHTKEYTEAKKSIKKAIKLAKKAHWNTTDLKAQKRRIESHST